MAHPEDRYTDHITVSPSQMSVNLPPTHRGPHIVVQDFGFEEREGHLSPFPSKAATFPPERDDAPSLPRRTTWGGRLNSVESNIQDPGSPVGRFRRAKRTLTNLTEPEIPVGRPPGFEEQVKNILFNSWLNLLLFAIPISWALHFATPGQYVLVFVFSFLAIIPLSKLLEFVTDELSIRVGHKLAGLIHTSLGNAVELIFAILALVKCELRVVQSSFVGSILSKLLLVLGFCFFAGGTKFSEQGFAIGATQLDSSLLTLSVIGVLIPAAFDTVSGNGQISGFDAKTEQRDILKLSHGTAIVLLFIYFSYIYFQLFSHRRLYEDENELTPETIFYPPRPGPRKRDVVKEKVRRILRLSPAKDEEEQTESEEEKAPMLSVPVAVALLVVVTVLVATTAAWLVDSIDGLARGGKVSKEFIGLIFVPIINDIPTLVTAVTDSVKDELTSSLYAAVGSSIQIALFVIPSVVTLGWMIHRPITLLFDPFESIILFFSVRTVSYVMQDGRSNWLKGIILICLYIIVAVVFLFYPGTVSTRLLTCPS